MEVLTTPNSHGFISKWILEWKRLWIKRAGAGGGAGGRTRGLLVSSYHVSDMLSYLHEQGCDSHTLFGNKASQKGMPCDPR